MTGRAHGRLDRATSGRVLRRVAGRLGVAVLAVVAPLTDAAPAASAVPPARPTVVDATSPDHRAGAPLPPGRGRPGAAAASVAAPVGAPSPAECAALWARYTRSQACYARFRLANGGLKPDAGRHCVEVSDPSPRCGSPPAR